MKNPSGMCRKGQWNRVFAIWRKNSRVDSMGHIAHCYQPTGETLTGILSQARPEEKLRWEQVQHPVSHIIVGQGSANVREGDFLLLGDRAFYIQGLDNMAGLGHFTACYCEEQRDIPPRQTHEAFALPQK